MTGIAAAAYVRWMIRAIVIGAALALLLSGCGNGADKPEEGADASLHVKHVLDPAAEQHYMEGSIWHVRVVDADGAEVVDRKLPGASVSLRLGAGRYRLESEELPCDGNCSRLDPGTDGCSTELTVQPGQELAATVTLEAGARLFDRGAEVGPNLESAP